MISKRLISKTQALRRLERLFNGGIVDRLPKRAPDAQVLLALASASLIPGERYTEVELNDHLTAWLSGFTCPIGMDHVTMRRHLVDKGFLLRDPSGSVYRTNGTVTSSVLEPEARSIQPAKVFEKVQREREERKRAHLG